MSRKNKTPQPLSDEAYAALIHEVTRPKTAEEKRHIQLGWQLMEAKFQYYVLDSPTLSDHEYDQMEREYDALSKLLDVSPSASDTVGFNALRPSGALVADKIQGINPPKKFQT